MVKGLIVVGGHSKGTRFRPLSLDCPKPLFPIGGRPMIEVGGWVCLPGGHQGGGGEGLDGLGGGGTLTTHTPHRWGTTAHAVQCV